MTPQKKCANAACTCIPPAGQKYCSSHCEGMANKTEMMCHCNHTNCGGQS
jgi:hypothetical protein